MPVEIAARKRIKRNWRVQRISVLLVLLLALNTRLSAQRTTSIYDDALARFRAGNFSRGCAEAEQAVRQDPRFYAAYSLLGLCAVRRGDLRSAETQFRKALELNPLYLEARLNLGVNLVQQGKLKPGIAELKQALRRDPNNAKALFHLGRAELASGEAEEAVQHLRRANELAPGDNLTMLLLARAHTATGQKDEARALLESIIQSQREIRWLMPAAAAALRAGETNLAREALGKILQQDANNLTAILRMARDLSQEDEYRQVRTLLEVAQPFGQGSAEWNALLGYAEYKLRDPTPSAGHLRRAIELAPDTEEYYLKLEEMLLFYNSDAVAAEILKAGLARLPNSALLNYGLAVSYWAHDSKPDMARAQAEKTLSLHPDYGPALSLRAEMAYRKGDWKYLGELADRLMRAAPQAHDGYYFKAVALGEGQFSQMPSDRALETRRLLDRSIKLNPDFADAHNALGKLLLKRQELSLAIAEFNKAARLRPDDSEAYYHLAIAYRQAGDEEKSAQAISKFNELKSQTKTGWEVLFRVVK